MIKSHQILDLKKSYLAIKHNGADSLPEAASTEKLQDFEKSTNVKIPQSLQSLYLLHNGQAERTDEFFGNFYFCTIETAKEYYFMHKEIILDDAGDVNDFIETEDGLPYFSKYLISFGVQNSSYLSIHSITGQIWVFNPSCYSVLASPSLSELFSHLFNSANSGVKPKIFDF